MFSMKREDWFIPDAVVDSPRDTTRMKVNDLDLALDELTSGKPVSVPVTNPIGCNIKWEGKDAHWMPPDACDLV